MMKVLVTGASGFIGSYVIDELLNRGYHVIATSSSEHKAKAKSWYDKVQYIQFDLRTFDKHSNYFEYFDRPSILIHLAWEGLPNYNEDFHLHENLPRHTAFLSNLIDNGLTNLTVTGTCLEYGMQEGCLSETMQTTPTVPYAIAKDELKKKLFASNRPISLKWARLFYMYGPGQSPKSLISQLDQAIADNDKEFNMSGGEQVRDFLPVEAMAKYIVSIATQQAVNGVINCCSGEPVKLIDFINQYLAQKRKTIKLNLGYYDYPSYEPMRFWGDTSKLKSILKNE